VVFACFGARSVEAHEAALKRLGEAPPGR
jgi:hypothetical protein